MQRLTLDFVRSQFKCRGFELLERTYSRATAKLRYKCPEGHIHAIKWNDFQQGLGCPHCSGKAPLDLNRVLKALQAEGYSFLCGGARSKSLLRCKCPGGHTFSTSWSRFYRGSRCPYCCNRLVCLDNCLGSLRPDIAAEWHETYNEGLTPQDVLPGARKKVWWRGVCGCEWEASINGRTRGAGCPYCAGKKVSSSNCLAAVNTVLAKEWHPIKNLGLTSEEVTAGSNKKVWWQCDIGHEWESTVNSRSSGSGCPFCSGLRVLPDTSFASVNPEKVSEWDALKNTKEVSPETVSAWSNKKVWWVCAKGHSWRALISCRSAGSGCPYCSGQKVCSDNCLATINPELAEEWHPAKNLPTLSPERITAYSGKKVWWVCPVGHSWCSTVYNRASGHGCPECAGGSVSKASQTWLDSLGIPEEFREFAIKLSGHKRSIRVDGFDPATNTVYEFLGDFWHGNPARFDPQEVNPRTSEKYGVLYRRTMRRLERLRREGYTVVHIWEGEFKEGYRWQ